MKKFVNQRAHGRNARRAAHQHHFVDLFGSDARVGHRLLAGRDGALEHRFDQQFEDRARNLALIAVAVGQFDVELRGGFSGKPDLGVDCGLAQGLHRAGMRAQVHAVLGVNLVESDGEQQIVDVVAAQMRVAVGRLHLEDAVAQLEDGDIESPAAKIVNRDGARFGAIESVGQRRSRGLVHQPQHIQARHASCVFSGLALRVVEVRRYGDDRLRDLRAEEALGVALELAQNVGRNLGRRKAHLAQLDARNLTRLDVAGKAEGEELQLRPNLFESAAHQALDGVDDALRRLDERLACAVANRDRGPAAACGEHGIERNH